MIRLLLLVVPLAALAACKTENKAFCDDPNNAGLQGCPGDATNGGGCGSDGDCKMMGFPACEKTINNGTCEPCTASNLSACMGTTPRCESNACVACVDDAMDCKGGVCLATGDCADTSRIIHASSSKSGMSTTCGDTPATACSLKNALVLAAPDGKSVIKLDDAGPFTENGFTVINDVTIDARGATLNRADNGPVVTVNDGKSLTILGGIISNATGSGGDGIKCGNGSKLAVYDSVITTNNEMGIEGNGCTISVTHAKITNNSKAAGATVFPGIGISNGSITISRSQIISNRGGGISVGMNSTFTVVGNMFLSNGDSNGLIGGLGAMTTVPGNRLEFNTFAENISAPGVGAGVQCQAPSVAPAVSAPTMGTGALAAPTQLVAQNNIIWNNNGPSGLQVFGNCTHSFSDIGPTAIPTTPINLDGGNNFSMDPAFVGPTTDLEVNATTPIRGKGNPAADLGGIASVDINGVKRTVRPGAGPDPGAYVAP